MDLLIGDAEQHRQALLAEAEFDAPLAEAPADEARHVLGAWDAAVSRWTPSSGKYLTPIAQPRARHLVGRRRPSDCRCLRWAIR